MNPEPDVDMEVREDRPPPPDVVPDITDLVIRDDTPVESIFAEKLYRLLTEALESSWPGPGEGRTFLVLSNVALFHQVDSQPVVPDVLLSLDVPAGLDLQQKENNSYYIWRFGKVPDVVIEVVSDHRGGEDTTKSRHYARLGVPYYVIFDPRHVLGDEVLRCHVLVGRSYQSLPENWFQDVGLGLRTWEGTYAGHHATWLRWCDERGNVIPTGQERAEQERQRAEQVRREREVFAAKLRELGIDPATLTEKQP